MFHAQFHVLNSISNVTQFFFYVNYNFLFFQGMKCKIPVMLKNILGFSGFDNEFTLREFNKELEITVKTVLPLVIADYQLQEYFGVFAKDPQNLFSYLDKKSSFLVLPST